MSPKEYATPVRIGAVGCGDIAWRKTLPAIKSADETRLVAVSSRERAKAERFADAFGGDAVEGYERLLERPDVDAIYLAVPTGLHHVWAKRILEAGKHLLVEKPLATSLAEVDDLVETARRCNLSLMVNFAFPYHSQHETVRRMINEGAIGTPRMFSSEFCIPPRPGNDVRYNPQLGGGALLDVGVYTVRAAQMVLDQELTVQGSVLRTDSGSGVDVGGGALLCSADGIPAQLAFSFESSYSSSYSVWGSEGRIRLDRAFTPPASLSPTLRLERQDQVTELSLPPDDQYRNLIQAFAHSIMKKPGDHGDQVESLRRHAMLVDRIRSCGKDAATPVAVSAP